MPRRTNTTFLLASHGRKGVRAPLSPEQVARRIVQSIQNHKRLGIYRTPSEYAVSTDILMRVQSLLQQGEES